MPRPQPDDGLDGEVLDEVVDLEDWFGHSARSLRTSSSTRTHAVSTLPNGISGGGSGPAHTSAACGQRGRNAQPLGGADHVRRRSGDRRQPLTSEDGERVEQPLRVRVRRPGEDVVRRSPLGRTAGVHHLHAVGHPRDHAEVVGDQHDGGVRARSGSAAAPRGSAPAPSRRAPSSARRRSAPRDRWRSPSRSSRAGACRRRTRAGTARHVLAAAGSRRARGGRRPSLAASRCVIGSWARIISTICAPIGCTGLSADSGSWKIIAIFCRAPSAGAFDGAPTSCCPSTIAEPVMIADGGSRPITPRNVTLLPEPLSPTMPTSSPRRTSRSTPRTACTSPLCVLNVTW